jgi:hypothetical protein
MPDQVQVRGPDGQMFRFPATMAQEEITSALDEHYGRTLQPEAPQMGRGEAFGRGVADGLGLGFADEVGGLTAVARSGPRFAERFRDDEGSFLGDAAGFVGDIYGTAIPALDVARGGFEMATGFDDDQRHTYEGVRDSVREGLETAQDQHKWSTLGGQVGGGILNAALTGGMGGAPSVARAGLLGAGYGGAYGVGSGEGAVDRLIQGGIGAGIGGLSGAAIQAGVNAVGPTVRNIARRFRRAGQAASSSADDIAAIRAGRDPETMRRISRISQQIDDIDDALARGQIDDATAQRIRDFRAAGMSGTRGQQTRSRDDLLFEEQARNRARGDFADLVMQAQDQSQARQRVQYQQRIAEGFGPQQSVAESANDAGQAVRDSVRAAYSTARNAANRAYAEARRAGAMFRTDSTAGLGQRVREHAAASRVSVSPRSMPQAADALQLIDDLEAGNIYGLNLAQPRLQGLTQQGDDVAVAGISFDLLEEMRGELVAMRQAAYSAQGGARDARAVSSILEAFDDWIDDAANAGLYSGDDAGVEAFKRARAMWSQMRDRFGERGPGDVAGRRIADMLDPNRDIDGVSVANWLYGSASAGRGNDSLALARRLKQVFGANSEQLQAVRQGYLARLLGIREPGAQTIEGVNAPAQFGIDRMITSLENALAGRGDEFVRELYTPAQLGDMQRLLRVLKNIQTPRNLRNPSGSGHEAVRGVFGQLVERLGIPGVRMSRAFIELLGNGQNVEQARAALAGALMRPTRMIAPRAVGASGSIVANNDPAQAGQGQ